MSGTVTHDTDCDCEEDTNPIDPADLADMVTNATPRGLIVAESTMIVHIGAGVEVCQSSRYLDAIHEEMRRRGIAPHGEDKG